MKKIKYLVILLILAGLVIIGNRIYKKITSTKKDPQTGYTIKIGSEVDDFNGVKVYYNGSVGTVVGRNLTPDGYNLGLKYQCVEFVKRYYYEYYGHKMPDSYGHAKDFFDSKIKDGEKNPKRNLIQYKNSSSSKPKVSDLIIFGPTISNRYGHVAIISEVSENQIEIVQQNPGPYANSRVTYPLANVEGKWKIENDRVLGWLRKEDKKN
ncbi:CHAP domain-containing protein [Fusobacterium sp. PH5-44]|uniref:CHAP domain-containing protein n=1 Tax=unclassified Fusobacterium TaxID=2648384 RepID=UPI003D202060